MYTDKRIIGAKIRILKFKLATDISNEQFCCHKLAIGIFLAISLSKTPLATDSRWVFVCCQCRLATDKLSLAKSFFVAIVASPGGIKQASNSTISSIIVHYWSSQSMMLKFW
ncbi:hypothetical protein ACFE04_021431 [Oxalis oulophora]